MKTIELEVIALAAVAEPADDDTDAEPPAAVDGVPVAVDLPVAPRTASGEIVIIHVAPSPRLDPSKDLDRVEIVAGEDEFDGVMRTFIVE